ncbi:tudor and KH domain-containing protein homolog isoform X2 [Prorops nasuta]
MIKNILANQALIEVDEITVPDSACSKIIGRGGENINEIQHSTNTKVIIDRNRNQQNQTDSTRRIIVKGTRENIDSALIAIREIVQECEEVDAKSEADSLQRLPRKSPPRNGTANTVKNIKETIETLSTERLEGLMEVYVSAMVSLDEFWVQVVGSGSSSLDKLIEEMTKYYNNVENREAHILNTVTEGQIVAAQFDSDKKWYRAEVLSKLNEGKCEVFFVDFGDREIVYAKNIYELRTDFLSLRLQAIECSLANIKPCNEWSEEVLDRFEELAQVAQWKKIIAKVTGYKERAVARGRCRREGSPIPIIELYDKYDNMEINVGQVLLEEDLVDFKEQEPPNSTITNPTPRWNPSNSVLRPESSSDVIDPNLSRSIAPNFEDYPDVSLEILEPTSSTNLKISTMDSSTPKKSGAPLIDLVTPDRRDANSVFIESERNILDDSKQEGYTKENNSGKFKIHPQEARPPAGFESDESEFSDGFD